MTCEFCLSPIVEDPQKNLEGLCEFHLTDLRKSRTWEAGGYKWIYIPNRGKIREHRYIMEQHLGRSLRAEEHIHHKNHDPLDNRIENLEIMTQSAHISLHHKRLSNIGICAFCDQSFTRRDFSAVGKCCSRSCAGKLRQLKLK